MSDLYEAYIPIAYNSANALGLDFYLRLPTLSDTQSTEVKHGYGVKDDALDRIADSVAVPVRKPAKIEVQCANYFARKSTIDRGLTALLMIVALPLMLAIGLAILLLEGRPVFYRQIRVGKHGRTFRIWKFRTMCRDAESTTGAVWSSTSDPRVSTLGRWLRCSHLDELPQFFNVLAGDMNLIGPRPERPEFVRELSKELPLYSERLNVDPGITGLAQLKLGYDQSLADVEQKVLLDLQYIRTASMLGDARLLLATLPHIAMQLLAKWKADWTSHAVSARIPNSTRTATHRGVSVHLPGSPSSLKPQPLVD